MSVRKHTPGPWEVWADDEVFSVTTKKVVVPDSDCARNTYDDDMVCRSESKANARLIAAAPELLDSAQLALSIAESWIHDQLDGTSHLESAMQSLDPVRAAIAKATGESK